MKKANGEWVVSSAAFSPSKVDKAVSVDLEQLLHEDGLASETLYPSLDRSVGLYAIIVQDLLNRGIDVLHDAIRRNWYHGLLRGDPLSSAKTRKDLAKICVAVVPIDQEEAERLERLHLHSLT